MLGDPGQDVGQPSVRIDVVQFGGDNQAVHRCGALAAAIRTRKKSEKKVETRVKTSPTPSSPSDARAGPEVRHTLGAGINLRRPGIRKTDLQIQAKDRTIRLAGTKPVEYGEKASLHRRERLSGSFDRAVTLPVEIDADRVRAEYHDGILALYLPRAERDKPKAITVA